MTTVEMIQHPFLRKGIEPRLFQQTILNTCIKKNTLVVLPTGTGKTIISILHIAYLLQKNDISPGDFILIMAPTKPLVNQHAKSFRSFLKIAPERIVELSGAVTPANRKKLIEKALIVIATPQTIRNDLIHNYIDPKKCKLVYFDEAHRARGDYDYVPIADIIQKYNPNTRFIALSASPGTDREGILEICRNLFIEAIESRPKDDPEISKYIQDVEFERIEVPLPMEFETILSIIDHLGEREVEFLKSKGITDKRFSYLYKGELLNIKNDLSRNFRANYLEIMVCNRLIYIQILKETLESQGIPSAFVLINNWREKNSKSIKGLFNLQEFSEMVEKIEFLKEKGVIHPKLLYLLDILDGVDLINSRVLIFCNLRATCHAISGALKERGFDARPFVGQSRGKEGGLSQKNQIAILEAFRKDAFPILISTSVLEEGLDVDECNLVIFYDGTPSAIRKIQRSGRTGRKKKGRVIILTTHHTIDTAAHFVSNARERNMNRLLFDITWINEELSKPKEEDHRIFAPIKSRDGKTIALLEENDEEIIDDETLDQKEPVNEKLASFKMAIEDLEKWEEKTENDETEEKVEDAIKIIVDSREKNSKILFYLKKEGIDLDFKQLDCGDYILSDRVAVEYKKGDDLLSSIIDGRLFEQLGFLTNAYQIPILLIEGFPTGGIHPEAIAGALSSFIIDFGVSIIQTQNSEETATILKRIAIREQKVKKRRSFIRKAMKMSNPNENAIQIISSYPGINRTLASRLLESLGSVRNVVNASIDDLKNIDGLGTIKSEKLVKLSNQEYQ
ncbi:MAG TPA: ERCC4 domain-containing protein [Candidatus Bathyarchaeia archaeon]|nr:ERCC4 domain-containing protein [Candidatus Bathyarchaeia archaeon]